MVPLLRYFYPSMKEASKQIMNRSYGIDHAIGLLKYILLRKGGLNSKVGILHLETLHLPKVNTIYCSTNNTEPARIDIPPKSVRYEQYISVR